jgi:hypothetical protein
LRDPKLGIKKKARHTVIKGITAPAAIEAITAITIMMNSFLLAYRNSAKYPTSSFGASICLSIISLSCSLSPAIGGFTISLGAPCFSSIATSDEEAADGVVIIEICAQVRSMSCRRSSRVDVEVENDLEEDVKVQETQS